MNNKKAYIIRGSVIEEGSRKEWIEKITISKERAEKIKKDLNISLVKKIERGKDVFDLYLKDKNNKAPWDEMEFHTDKMNEDEFDHFCMYRYGTKLPFRIDEVELA